MRLVTAPVTVDRWDDLVDLFGDRGATRGCWCMARRLPAASLASNGNLGNRRALRSLVEAGEPVGLLGYVEGRPVAWCAVAPRSAYRTIVSSRTLPIDDPDLSVWAITCFYIAAGYRRRGLMAPLIEAAVAYAAGSGAELIEAYPVSEPPGDVSRGLLGTFLDAGFTVHAPDRTTSRRNVVVRLYPNSRLRPEHERGASRGGP